MVSIKQNGQLLARNPEIDKKEKELANVRRHHFTARSSQTKEKYRERDKQLRQEIQELLKESGLPNDTAEKLAQWDPYNQNTVAHFFNSEWMFGIHDGFDIVIGNPPYVRQEQIKEMKPILKEQYTCFTGIADIYVYFYERGFQLLKVKGILAYVSSNKYFRAGYGEKLRGFLSQNTTLLQIIDFGDTPIFTAIAYPSILLLKKGPSQNQHAQTLTWKFGSTIEEFPTIFQKHSFHASNSNFYIYKPFHREFIQGKGVFLKSSAV